MIWLTFDAFCVEKFAIKSVNNAMQKWVKSKSDKIQSVKVVKIGKVTMRIIICDDNLETINFLTQKIEKGFCEFKPPFIDVVIDWIVPDDIEKFMYEKKFDGEFLFINCKFNKNKIQSTDVAAAVNIAFPEVGIVYYSDDVEDSLNIYDTDFMYYFRKDEIDKRIDMIIRKMFERIGENNSDFIKITSNKAVFYIRQSSILYIERNMRKLVVVMKNRRLETYESLGAIMNDLNEWFLRCHGSYIINTMAINEIRRESFVMSNGTEIPIGRTYVDNVTDRVRVCKENVGQYSAAIIGP